MKYIFERFHKLYVNCKQICFKQIIVFKGQTTGSYENITENNYIKNVKSYFPFVINLPSPMDSI